MVFNRLFSHTDCVGVPNAEVKEIVWACSTVIVPFTVSASQIPPIVIALKLNTPLTVAVPVIASVPNKTVPVIPAGSPNTKASVALPPNRNSIESIAELIQMV